MRTEERESERWLQDYSFVSCSQRPVLETRQPSRHRRATHLPWVQVTPVTETPGICVQLRVTIDAGSQQEL